MDPDQLLSQLQDIQLPPTPHWWPPAPGWWVLLLIALVLLGYLLKHAQQAWRHRRLRKTLLNNLDTLFKQQKAPQAELSMMLRRLVLSRYPAQQSAALLGEDWLCFLDKSAATNQFSQGAGRCLLDSPYQRAKDLSDATRHALHQLSRRWIKHNY